MQKDFLKTLSKKFVKSIKKRKLENFDPYSLFFRLLHMLLSHGEK